MLASGACQTLLGLVLLAPLAAIGPGEEAQDHAILEAALRHAGERARCTRTNPCCFAVDSASASGALAKRLAANLRPAGGSRPCGDHNTQRNPLPKGNGKYELVEVAFRVQGASIDFTNCVYSLARAKAGWRVLESETGVARSSPLISRRSGQPEYGEGCTETPSWEDNWACTRSP